MKTFHGDVWQLVVVSGLIPANVCVIRTLVFTIYLLVSSLLEAFHFLPSVTSTYLPPVHLIFIILII